MKKHETLAERKVLDHYPVTSGTNKALLARLAKAWASCFHMNTGRTHCKAPSPNQKCQVTLSPLGSHLHLKLIYFQCCSCSVQQPKHAHDWWRNKTNFPQRDENQQLYFSFQKHEIWLYAVHTAKESRQGKQSCDDKREGDPRTVGNRNELLRGLIGPVTRLGSEKGSIMIYCWAVKGTWLSGISGCACPSQDCFWYSGECSQQMKNLLFFQS